MGDLYFPVPQWIVSYSYKTEARKFAAGRVNTTRVHAGCDLYAPLHATVKAITGGVVVEKGSFYEGVDQISVSHPDIGVVRYGEIIQIPKNLVVGGEVTAGMTLGIIPQIITKRGSKLHPMLHIELFKGTAAGSLTDRGNSANYSFVTVRNYQRRSDLLDPTAFLDKLYVEGIK